MNRVLAVRLDSDGDVLITGPAIRALAHRADGLDLLVSPAGHAAGELLPGVAHVLTFNAPWSGYLPPPVDPAAIESLTGHLRRRNYDRAVIFTSFHQSPLPMALLARMAGIPFVAASSVDYPGSLLDVRHQRLAVHEVEAALELAVAAGGRLPPGDDGRLRIRTVQNTRDLNADGTYVVVHPGASVPSRALAPEHAASIVKALTAAGWPVVVTGGPAERELARVAAGDTGIDLAGDTDLPGLAAVIADAACVVVGNTGPAHLAAAVGTPVVSLFSPVVPAARWRPYRVPTVLLGNQHEACRDTRARACPIVGHPCLSQVSAARVAQAVGLLARVPVSGAPR
jgi:ADP-heptose:LPS heptosyltransferase